MYQVVDKAAMGIYAAPPDIVRQSNNHAGPGSYGHCFLPLILVSQSLNLPC